MIIGHYYDESLNSYVEDCMHVELTIRFANEAEI
jgi:hypothetical protein